MINKDCRLNNEDKVIQSLTPSDGLAQQWLSVNALYNKVALQKPHFIKRQVQQDIIQDCIAAFYHKQILVAQAGTGVGKTLSYVLSALPFLQTENKQLIISTNTIALQQQLINKDLPDLLAIASPNMSVEIAKGSGRYLCLYRLHSVINKVNGLLNDDETVNASSRWSKEEVLFLTTLDSLVKTNDFDGDFDTLPITLESRVISAINRDSEQCMGANTCSFSAECSFYQQREKIEAANIIVTNHALLANTALRGGSTLCNQNRENQLLVVDEAHQLPSVLREIKQESFSITKVIKSIQGMTVLDKQVNVLISMSGDHANTFTALARHLVTLTEGNSSTLHAVELLNSFLNTNFQSLKGQVTSFDDKNSWVMSSAEMPFTMKFFLDEVCESFSKIVSLFDCLYKINKSEVVDILRTTSGKTNTLILKYLSTFQQAYRDIVSANDCLQLFMSFAQLKTDKARIDSGIARWVVKEDKGVNNSEFTLQANYLHIGSIFQDNIVAEFHSVLLTSATLEQLGTVKYFLKSLSIDKQRHENKESVRVVRYSSPFDYSKVKLSTPIFKGDPNSEKHDVVVLENLLQLRARHKAILVLFTSNKALKQTYNLCSDIVKSEILQQANYSKNSLISLHKQRVNAGKTSILFGVDGLSEGIDLPRQYLTCVVIAKLPFASTSDPLRQYESNNLKDQGIFPFTAMSLPACSQKLVQGVGRLIRSEEDYGEILILDPRINTKRYGYELLSCLPMYSKKTIQSTAKSHRYSDIGGKILQPNFTLS